MPLNYSAIRYVHASRRRIPFRLRKRRRPANRMSQNKRAKSGTGAFLAQPTTQAIALPMLGGLPSMWRHFRFADKHYSVNPGVAGTLAAQVFSANSLFDPDRTGVGHQPMGYDQFMVFYKHYCVHSAKITIHFYNADATQPQYVGINLMPTNTLMASFSEYVEKGDGTYCLLDPLDSPGTSKSLIWNFNARRFFGCKNPDDVEDLKGLVGSSPADEAFFHVWVHPSAAADTSSVYFGVCIDFWAHLTEHADPTQS